MKELNIKCSGSIKLCPHHACLNTLIVLVFTIIVGFETVKIPRGIINRVIINLADLNAWIDSHMLDTRDLKRPISAEANITKSSGGMYRNTETADRRSSLQHRNKLMSLCIWFG